MRPVARTWLRAAAFMAAGAGPVAAQAKTATYTGIAVGDFSGEPIHGVAIAIPGLRRATSTDSLGRFSLTEVRAGTYEIAVRRVGYEPVNRRLVLQQGQVVEDTIRLKRVAVLESVNVSAGIIRSFEENRAIGLGKFLDRHELEKMKTRRTSEIIAEISRAAVINGRGNNAWLIGRRGQKSLNPKTCGAGGGGLDQADLAMGAEPCQCYSQVYLDKSIMYRNTGRAGEPLFNLNTVNPDQIEAIEYYPGPASTPLEYSTLNSQCGVLIIHTRRPR